MKYSISTINHITTALNFAKRCGYNINLDNPTTIQYANNIIHKIKFN